MKLFGQKSKPSDQKSDSLIFLVGDVEGHILEMLRLVYQKEDELKRQCDWILCTGSFGVWVDFQHLDKGTRKNGDPGDFHRLYNSNWVLSRNLLFVSGAHEDHFWLHRRKDKQVLGNVYHLMNGFKTCIGPDIVGLGKVYSPIFYDRENAPSMKRYKHYTRREVEKACSHAGCDIVLTHQGPLEEEFGRKKSISEGIKRIVSANKPQLLVHGAYNFSKVYDCMGIKAISLRKMEIVPILFDHQTKVVGIV